MASKTKHISANDLALLVLVCFFTSGMTGLIYEVLWTRMIVKIIGGAPFAVSIILTIFMGGLGLGSWIAGRTIDRIAEPGRLVKIYGLLELAIGAYGLVLPLLIAVFAPLFAVLYNAVFSTFMLYNLLTFVGCAILLLFPVVCMGATLPVLSRFYVSSLSHIGTHTGRLYGLNTVGAGVGALLTGFWFLSSFGVWGTLAIAVILNGVIGLVTIAVSGRVRGIEKHPTPQKDTAPEKDAPAFPYAVVIGSLIVFAVSGFCSMSYEVIWTKLLGLIVGPTTYSFTLVLVTFIFGLALGAMFFGWLADRTRRPVQLLLITQVAAAVFALGVSQLFGNSQLFFAKLIATYQDQFVLLNIMKAFWVFVIMLPPTLCLGATFPLVGKIFTPSAAKVGRSIGVAYAINTIGAVLGSFVAGFVIIPAVGKSTGLSLVIGLQLLNALVFGGIILARKSQRILTWAPSMLIALIVLGVCFAYPKWDKKLLAVGKYHRLNAQGINANSISWMESLLDGPRIVASVEHSDVIYYGDGVTGVTTVLESHDAMGNDEFSMANSGKPEASTRGDMPTQTMLAHFPMLFTRDAKNVMLIGLASGVTAGEVLYYPIDRLDVIEISSKVVTASDYFREWNNNVLADPRVHLIVQDGRAHMGLTDRSYDVIISEPSNPWMAGLAALFTRDCFEYAHERLNDNGMFVQFIHAYQMDWPTFALVGRTFADVFPNAMLVATDPSDSPSDYMLVGIKGDRRLDIETARQNLQYVAQSGNVTITDPRLPLMLIKAENLKLLFGDGPTNTDSHPRLEFAAPKLMFEADLGISEQIAARGRLTESTARFVQQARDDVDAQLAIARWAYSVHLPFHGSVPAFVDLAEATPDQAAAYFSIVDRYCRNNPPVLSLFQDDSTRHRCALCQIERLQHLVDIDSADAQTFPYLAHLYANENQIDQELAVYQKWLAYEPRNVAAFLGSSRILLQQGRTDPAIKQLLAAQRIEPENVAVLGALGMAYGRAGNSNAARQYLERALRLDPNNAAAHGGLGLLLASQGKYDEAVAELMKALELDPGNRDAQAALQKIQAARSAPLR